MARYSRRTGPALDYIITGTFTDVPDLAVTRFFDEGELLILLDLEADATGVGTEQIRTRLAIDGVAVPNSERIQSPSGLAPDLVVLHSRSFLVPVAAGVHTIAPQIDSPTAPTLVPVKANRATLIVIQLPSWDRDSDIL